MESLIGELQLGVTGAAVVLGIVFAVLLTRKWTKAEDKLDGVAAAIEADRTERKEADRKNASEHADLWSKVNGVAADVGAMRESIGELRGELRAYRPADQD